MKPTSFKEQTKIIEKGETQYEDLPIFEPQEESQKAAGLIVTCWKLSILDRVKILFTGRVWHQMMTFHQPIQPQLLSVDKPLMENIEKSVDTTA